MLLQGFGARLPSAGPLFDVWVFVIIASKQNNLEKAGGQGLGRAFRALSATAWLTSGLPHWKATASSFITRIANQPMWSAQQSSSHH
jgi:hypothetical protein